MAQFEPKSLALLLRNHWHKSNRISHYYGLVDYKWKYQLDKLPKDKKIVDALRITKPDKKHIETLLIKRKSYSYENEVRLFCIPDSSLIDSKDKHLCRLKLNPLDFITSVRFDPGMEYKEFIKHKKNS